MGEPEPVTQLLEEPAEEDVQGDNYEFYVLLQQLKAGGISFDTFIERATAWALTRMVSDRQHSRH